MYVPFYNIPIKAQTKVSGTSKTNEGTRSETSGDIGVGEFRMVGGR